MSQISLKSISGITSITTPAGVDNRFSLYNYDSTERFVLDHSGNLNISGVTTATNFKSGSSNLHSTGLTVGDSFVHSTGVNLGTGVTFSNNGNATFSGIITATQFKGDGSQLTGITQTTISGNGDNKLITGSGTANTLIAEAELTFDGTSLKLTDHKNMYFGTGNDLRIWHDANNNYSQIAGGQKNLYIDGLTTYMRSGDGGGSGVENAIVMNNNASVDLYYSGTKKFETTSSGATVTGTLTATAFSGNGANLTNLPSSLPPQNFLINGAMLINVRGTDHQTLGSFNPVTSSIYTLDRWKVLNSNSFDTDSAKVVQDNGAPTSEGFRKSIMMNIGNTETPSSNQVCGFQQKIEAQNLQSLAYGTSSAKTMTLSFWVYSNKTGTYCVQIMQDDVNKYVLYEYTISSSNTWEKKTITVAGNTSDAINNDNGIGLEVNWILCVGSGRQASATSSWTSGGYYVATSNQVNLWDHADNYFKMTGCQLQVGAATDFIHEDIGTTLRKCQRYFYMACGPDGGGYETIGTGMIYYSGTGYASCYFPTTMRTQPSLKALSGTSGAYMYQTLLSNTAAYTHQIAIDTAKTSLNSASVSCACPSSRNGEAFRLSAHFSHDANAGQSFVNFDAEL